MVVYTPPQHFFSNKVIFFFPSSVKPSFTHYYPRAPFLGPKSFLKPTLLSAPYPNPVLSTKCHVCSLRLLPTQPSLLGQGLWRHSPPRCRLPNDYLRLEPQRKGERVQHFSWPSLPFVGDCSL